MPERPGKQFDTGNAPKGATVWKLLRPLEAEFIHRLRALGHGRLEKVEVQNGMVVSYERMLEKVRLGREQGEDGEKK